MIKLFTTFCLFVTVQSSDYLELQVKTVKYGENVTFTCDQNIVKDKEHDLAWFKQSLGKLPQLIVNSTGKNEKYNHSGTFTKDRFPVTANNETFNLTIKNVKEEDTGTYFCVKVKNHTIEFASGTLLLFSEENSTQTRLTTMVGKSGDSLQCSVHSVSSSCAGKHSVYWFRPGSEESHPGVIYHHGGSGDQCNKGSETDSPTQSCVYNLPKNNLSQSDAGTYYCAVATCGEILFGNLLEENNENNTWLIIAVTSNIVWIVLIVVLTGLFLKNKKKGSVKEHQTNAVQAEDADHLNYAALTFAKKPTYSRPPRVYTNQDIYAEVRI